MLLFFSPSFYSKSYSFSSLFSFVCVIFKGIRRKDSISTRCTDFACMGGLLWIFHCLVYFCKRFQENELVFFLLFYLFCAIVHLDSNTTKCSYRFGSSQITAVVQITAILLKSSMKEIALHFEECRYWQLLYMNGCCVRARLGRSEGTFREERNSSCGFCFAETSWY